MKKGIRDRLRNAKTEFAEGFKESSETPQKLEELFGLLDEWDQEIADDLARDCLRRLFIIKRGGFASLETVATATAASGLLRWLEARRAGEK